MTDKQTPSNHSAKIALVVFFFCLSLVLLVLLPSQTRWIKNIILVKQPGFWSILSVTTMLMFSMLFLFFKRHRLIQYGKNLLNHIWHRRTLYLLECCLWFLTYVWLVPYLGYLPSTLLFMVLLTWRHGFRSKWMLISAALTAITIVVVFRSIMQVKIPPAKVYQWLPDSLSHVFISYF